jgi:hypothetical protein
LKRLLLKLLKGNGKSQVKLRKQAGNTGLRGEEFGERILRSVQELNHPIYEKVFNCSDLRVSRR